jgi:PEP-CTERM motif-containing protein
MGKKKSSVAKVAFAACLLAGATVPLSGAQAVSYFQNFNNVGFEGASFTSATGDNNNEKYPNPTIQFYQAADFAGWTFSGSGNPGSTFFQAFDATGTFSDGAILLNENGPGTASYTLTGLAPNSAFQLSFLVYGDNRPGGQWGLNVSVNGGAPVNYSGLIGAAGSNPGTTETLSALSDSLGSAVLLFAQTGSVGEGSPIIDDVAVSQTPLPAALPMFLGGAGLIGLLARRRKRKVATAVTA